MTVDAQQLRETMDREFGMVRRRGFQSIAFSELRVLQHGPTGCEVMLICNDRIQTVAVSKLSECRLVERRDDGKPLLQLTALSTEPARPAQVQAQPDDIIRERDAMIANPANREYVQQWFAAAVNVVGGSEAAAATLLGVAPDVFQKHLHPAMDASRTAGGD